jgi:hypothetical protein
VADEFVFAPSDWDIAMVFAIDLRPAGGCCALADLADAMVMWAEGDEAEELTTRAITALWSAEFEEQIRAGIASAGDLGDDWRRAAAVSAAEFEAAPQESAVTRAALQQYAWAFGHEGAPPLFCLCCIDEAIARAPADDRRRHAVEVALLTIRDAAIPEHEVAAALAASAPGRLATDDRRLAVRRRLGRLGHCGRNSLSALAAELERIGAEPLPVDPADDDVWEVVAYAVLAELAQPALN